jgi:hypothetical protein
MAAPRAVVVPRARKLAIINKSVHVLERVLAPPPGCVEFVGWIQGWRGTGERHTLATFCEPSGFDRGREGEIAITIKKEVQRFFTP